MPSGRKPKYDWAKLRHDYVTGDDSVTLEYLSNLEDSPTLGTIKRRSAAEKWTDEREMYRYNVATKKLQKATVKDASISNTQLQDAKLLRARAYASLKHRKDAVLDDREIRFYLQAAAELERKAMGLDQLHVQLDKHPSLLTTEELQQLMHKRNLLPSKS